MIPRPGKPPSGKERTFIVSGKRSLKEVRALLRRLVNRVRRHWPGTRVTIRGDNHYGREEAMSWREANGAGYVFGFAGDSVPGRLIEPEAGDIQTPAPKAGSPPRAERCLLTATRQASRYAETRHAAKSWARQRRAVARIEAGASDRDDTPRRGLDIGYAVTSLTKGRAEYIHATLYRARGRAENLVKQHKARTASGRTSRRPPLANQTRLVPRTAAYWLLLDPRDRAPSWRPSRQSEFASIRLRLLKACPRAGGDRRAFHRDGEPYPRRARLAPPGGRTVQHGSLPAADVRAMTGGASPPLEPEPSTPNASTAYPIQIACRGVPRGMNKLARQKWAADRVSRTRKRG